MDVVYDKISLAGDLGSGKSTVAKILLERLGAEYYSTGAIVRSIAQRRGMSVVELNVYMETHPEIDTEIDDGLVALGELNKRMVIDSRMAWHFTKGTFKVYLTVDAEVSALRIMNANREGEHAATLEETVAETKARRQSEKKRYLTQYGVDIKNLTNYSLVVDTTSATPEQVAECILQGLELWRQNPEYQMAFISPGRLNFPDDEPDAQKLSEYCAALESGEAAEEVCVLECDGEFYVISGVESALAHSFNTDTYVPCRIVEGAPPDASFVKIRNSL